MSRRIPFTVCFSVLLAAHLSLVLTTRLYPFIDLPNHLAEATLLRYSDTPTNQFNQYYSVHPGLKPNTFHTFFCALPVFPSVELANRVLLCMYILLVPISVLLIVTKLRGNPWLTLPSFLLVYNYSVTWGFIGYTLAIPIILIFFRVLLSVWSEGGFTSRLIAGVLLAFLFFLHALAALFGLLLLAAGSACVYRREWRKLLAAALTGLPAIVLVARWWFAGRTDTGPDTGRFLWEYYLADFLPSLTKRVPAFLLYDNYSLRQGWPGFAAAAAFSAAIVLPLCIRVLRRRHGTQGIMTGIALPAVLAGCALSCYLLLPEKLPGENYIFQRFAVLSLLSFTILSSVLYGQTGTNRLAALYTLLCLAHLLAWGQYFRQFNNDNVAFTPEFFPDRQQGKRLAGLISEYGFRGRPIYNHFSDYDIIWKQGIAVSGITDLRFGFVSRNVGSDVLPGSFDWLGKFAGYDGRFGAMDYLLVKGTLPGDSSGGLTQFHLLKSAGEWRLLER